jgi:hypothetical protein
MAPPHGGWVNPPTPYLPDDDPYRQYDVLSSQIITAFVAWLVVMVGAFAVFLVVRFTRKT